MTKKILILEDSKTYIEAYKNILKDYDLIIFDSLENAVLYLEKPEFNAVELAIVDINLGKGFKITGFNFAYKLMKKNPLIPVIICTGYTERDEVKKYAKIINAKILVKPFGDQLIKEVELLLNKNLCFCLEELDPFIKSFMSSAIYLKHILTLNYRIPDEYNDTFASVDTLEEYIVEEYEKMKSIYEKNCDLNIKETDEFKQFKINLKEYISNILFLGKSIIFSQIDLEEDENLLIDELSQIGHNLIKKLDLC